MKKIMTMVVAAMLATVSVNAQQEVGSFTIQPHRRNSRYDDQRRHCPQGNISSQTRQDSKRWKHGRC